ncbi:MAG: VOC family protein, partial [Acetobacteraceae bacterium]|nr:VOC family protein [Acetobacteraceae bacterium]
MTKPTPAALTHMGIYVRDLPRMREFYTTVLGLTVTDQGVSPRLGSELCFMSADPKVHHQVVLVSGRPESATYSTVMQISFTVPSLAALRDARDRALAAGGTDMRQVSHGNAWSIYFADPEGNVIEMYLDSPFHVPQPHGVPIDLDRPEAEIMAETEAACRKDPGFMMRSVWEQRQAARMQ